MSGDLSKVRRCGLVQFLVSVLCGLGGGGQRDPFPAYKSKASLWLLFSPGRLCGKETSRMKQLKPKPGANKDSLAPLNCFGWILTIKSRWFPNFVRDQWQAGMFHFWSQWEAQFKELSSWMCEMRAGSGSALGFTFRQQKENSWSFCADTVSWLGKTISVISFTLIVSIHNFKRDGCKNDGVSPASFWFSAPLTI